MYLFNFSVSASKMIYLARSEYSLNQFVRNYAMKSDLKIKWIRPPKVPCFHPEKSGDLSKLPPVDGKRFPLEFQHSEELKNANELVQRVFSLELSTRKDATKVLIKDMVDSVKRHEHDLDSPESKIARMTLNVRNMQELLERYPANKDLKVNLKELIDRRKKHLKFLRRWDYKRFEWLLEKLDLVYKSPPSHFHWITRKESLRKLTDLHCETIKQQRLAVYKTSLEEQQISFLQEKVQKLQWIRKEEQECGVLPTVSESDIEQVLEKLKKLQLSRERNQSSTKK